MRRVMTGMVCAAALSSCAFAADSLESMFKEGKASGQVRAFYINRDYDKRNETATVKDRAAFALGGKLGFDTASYAGLSLGAVLYTTNGLGLKADDIAKVDPTLFATGANKPDITYLGQAYLVYNISKTTVKVGRQQLDTPLAGSDDARMLPNLFEAAVVINKDLPGTTVIAAHVTREAAGSFANGYGVTGAGLNLALQSGYGAGKDTGKFVTMSKEALGGGVKDKGVSAVAAIYSGVPGLTAQIWDYYATDILNAIYAQADYKFNVGIDMVASYQFWNENGIGEKLGGSVKSMLNAAKLAGTPLAGANVYVAASKAEKQSGTGATLNGGMITPWGGTPGFVQGTVTRLGYTAGTSSYKVGASYDIIPGLNAHLSYAKFSVGKQAAYSTTTHDAGETDFDITYKPAAVKNLELKLRGIYARDFVPNQDFNEYRLIANYSF